MATKGVNPDEWLGILFTLQGTYTPIDVLSAVGTGALRFGLETKFYGTEGSFVNTVPLPASVLLVVFAVGVAGRKLRKFV
jgi:hypothetical protein